MYPLRGGNGNGNDGDGDDDDVARHEVINVAAHGADMCSMAKRLNVLYSDLSSKLPKSSRGSPDLIVLEFAVNDYQGQDHLITVDSKKSVFFEGFRDLVLCAEVVVHALLNRYPNAALMFLEMQTAIVTRKTGALLHMGVAQHYQIPVVSYAEALFPDFWRLIHALREMDDTSYTFPKDQLLLPNPPSSDENGYYGVAGNNNVSSSTVLPYPHGCSPCVPEDIVPQFRSGGCKSVCTFVERSGLVVVPRGDARRLRCDAKRGHIPSDRSECFVPFLAPDAVHPSAVGHGIAKDLIVHALASTGRDVCLARTMTEDKDPLLPLTTFVADGFDQLIARGDYLVVNDVARVFSRWDRLIPVPGSAIEKFVRYADDELKQRPGWIATDPKGNGRISFPVKLPLGP